VIVMYMQNAALERTGLGTSHDQHLVINNFRPVTGVDGDLLRAELERLPQVKGVTAMGQAPWSDSVNLNLLSRSPEETTSPQTAFQNNVGYDFFQTLDIPVLAGRAFGQQSPVLLYSPLVGVDLVADAAARATIELQSEFEHAVLCLRGAARVDGLAIEPGALHVAAPGRAHCEIACDASAQLLLIGGAPLSEPLLVWWNFVARTQAEIEAAAADWNAGRRFGEVPGTTLPRVPAPDLAGLRLKARTSDAR